MLIMVSSKKKVKISKNIIEKKKFRTFPTLKLSFTGSMRQDFAMVSLRMTGHNLANHTPIDNYFLCKIRLSFTGSLIVK